MTPDELLSTTRSVRKRLDLTRPVAFGLIEECLELALQAPTGGNLQTWHWLAITDQQLRAKIGEYYRISTERYLAARMPETAAQRRVYDSSAYLAKHMGDVPVQVIACIEAGTPWRAGESQAGLWGSLLPAAWSYMMACRARGLGTAWTTLHLRYEREIAELLGLPDGVRQGVLIPTAYYTGDTFRPAARRPLTEVLHVDGW